MAGLGKVDPQALLQLLEDEGLTYRTNKRSYIFTCPRCSKKDKLLMFRSDGRFVCWVCAETSGFKGRAEFALAEMTSLSIPQIQEKIYGEHYGENSDPGSFQIQLIDFFEDEPIPQDLIEETRGIQFPLDFYPMTHEHSRRGLEYLQGRGLSLALCLAYDLRYCPVQRRVVFPVKIGPKLVGWQARAIFETEWYDEEAEATKKAPKILTTGKRETVLMFQDQLAGSDHAIICEGPVDALKCHLVGGNVATMGKVVSRQQLEIVRRSGVRKVYLGLDDDAATETMKLCSALGDLELYRLRPAPGYEDLGAMPLELVREQFRLADRAYPGQLFLHFDA